MEYSLELFRSYYQLITATRGEKGVGGDGVTKMFDITPSGLKAVLRTLSLSGVKGWKTTWFFLADSRNFPHNWTRTIPDDQFECQQYSK